MDLRSIPLKRIETGNDTFKISRPGRDDRLAASIGRFGVINPPVLLEGTDGYVVIQGHNRLETLRAMGREDVSACIVSSFDMDDFLRHALVKEYYRGIGPIGKARLARLLKNDLSRGRDDVVRLCARGFSLPETVAADEAFLDFILSLPQPLRDYCDSKDVSFKVLARLRTFPSGAVAAINSWMALSWFKVNIFKSIVEMLDDIYRRDGDLGCIDGADPGERKSDVDAWAHGLVFRHRYPEFCSLRERAGSLSGEFSSSGIRVEIPHNFEGSVFRISFDIDARDSLDETMVKIGRLNRESIMRLLEAID